MQIDGCFDADVASTDSSMNVYNFHSSHCHLLGFFELSCKIK